MLSKIKLLSITICVAALLAGCRGEDGDPGPQGLKGTAGANAVAKIGYLSGTVSGTRQDGTSFSETFKYEYAADSTFSFTEDGNGNKIINITRYSNSLNDASMSMNLVQKDGTLAPATSYAANFSFIKELTPSSLFSISARAYFKATTAFVRNISSAQNKIYNFSVSYPERSAYYNEATYNDQDCFYFWAYPGNGSYTVYYSQSTGKLVAIYDSNKSKYITSGEIFDKFNKIKFIYSQNLDTYVFVDSSSGAALYDEFPDVAADALTITNYNYNTSTGILSFDYKLKISGYLTSDERINTTGHDLTITGSFNSGSKVYASTVGRVGN